MISNSSTTFIQKLPTVYETVGNFRNNKKHKAETRFVELTSIYFFVALIQRAWTCQ